MITKLENAGPLVDYFTPSTSKKFIEVVDDALRSLDLIKIESIFREYQIYHLDECQNFIGQLKHQFNSLKNDEARVVLLGSSKPRLSKCMGCEFGSSISAYRYEYSKRYYEKESKDAYYDVVYAKEFGVYFNVINNVLVELSVCNAFLTKEECDELNKYGS
ncbi:hypothetical protein DFR65_101104 [Oceanihabitans sediminis]|uniref:AAA domain-containing protein n=1 Tax=Oceanihabitans sediminis TaxID=1812012 RepID=A0A368P9J8_9FLAO|nr:hypothetical protein [Oceanihabitans sediminis]RBP34221.1 hypothetical protein DFR65_101104 [Oceanihabitans sediminis]RCU57911.1 hypothetical protein DU428_00515 [Oceanihabitans sediminis]